MNEYPQFKSDEELAEYIQLTKGDFDETLFSKETHELTQEEYETVNKEIWRRLNILLHQDKSREDNIELLKVLEYYKTLGEIEKQNPN